MQLTFTKIEGLGNDYLYFDSRSGENAADDWTALAQHICDRHFGVGADGIIVVESSTEAVARMRIWNADGSESEMCGNGLRGLAKWLWDQGINDFSRGIETGAGLLVPEVLETNGGEDISFRVMMGEPNFSRKAVGMDTPGDFLNESIEIDGQTITASAVSMGNPHLVIIGDLWDVEKMGLWGPRLEQHEWFRNRVNVHSINVADRHTIRMRHWERGAGQTLACGTGAAAATAVGIRLQLLDSPVHIRVPGGWLTAQWAGSGSPVYLTGPSREVFRGEYQWPRSS